MKQDKAGVFLGLAFIVAGIVMSATKKSSTTSAQSANEPNSNESVVGKRLRTVGDYANARSEAEVDNGFFTNNIGTVRGEFGVIEEVVKGDDGYNWYKVTVDDPSKIVGRVNPVFVRSDVATPV